MKFKLALLFFVNSIFVMAQKPFKENSKTPKKFEFQSYDVTPKASWIKENNTYGSYITCVFDNQANGYGVVFSTNTTFSYQHLRQADNEHLNDTLQKYISKGYFVSDVTGYGISKWSIVFSFQQKIPQQKIFLENNLPSEQIKEYSQTGYKISALARNDSKWLLVMSLTTDIEVQDFQSDELVPRDFIKDYWDQGFSITNIFHHKGLWTVVMSKTKDISLQAYETDEKFPTDWIRKKWKQGYRITSIAKNGSWLVVMSKFRETP